MPHFFATENDLLTLLLSIEEQRPLFYTLFGKYDSPDPEYHTSARTLPTLLHPQPQTTAIAGPIYLITETGSRAVFETHTKRWSVDQRANSGSVTLQHGGRAADRVLLSGRVATVHKTSQALELQRAFYDAFRTHFVVVGAFHVGREALQLLDAGWRLTQAAQSPPEFDLRRPIPGIGPGAEVVYTRRSLLDTWRFLEAEGMEMPRQGDGSPYIPDTMPNHDDEVLGFSYFRSGLEDADLSYLTLPRTFIGRSGFERVSFRNTCLAESRVCWNDFTECDFRDADLTGCDLRASIFAHCNFDGAILRIADLRHSTFEGCTFRGANVTGAIADESGGSDDLIDLLTEEQMDSMIWHDDSGEEPPGG